MDQEERAKSLDAEIARITKSTRTTVPAILSLHDILRQKYSWYYKWHLNPYASKVHTAILSLIIITGLAIGSLSVFGMPHFAKAATYTCTFNGSVNSNWSNAANWDTCNSEYPGQTGATSYDVTVPTTTSVTLDVASIDITAGGTTLGDVSVTGTLNTNGNALIVHSMTVNTGGALTMGASTITVKGSWSNIPAVTYNTSTVVMTGTGTITSRAGGYVDFNNLTINASGTITLSTGFGYAGIFTLQSGTLDGAQTVWRYSPTSTCFSRTGGSYGASLPTIGLISSAGSGSPDPIPAASATYPYPHLRITGNQTSTINYVKLAGAINTAGLFTIATWSVPGSVSLDTDSTNNYAITVGTDLVFGNNTGQAGALVANNSTIIVNGNVSFSNIGTSSTYYNTLTAGGSTINVYGNWDVPQPARYIFTAGTGTVDFKKASSTQTLNSGGTSTNYLFNNLTHSGAGTLQLSTNALDVDGTFTNSAGTFDANNLNMNFAGAWNNTGTATFSRGSGTLRFDGTTTLTDSSSNAGNLGAVTIDLLHSLTLGSNATMTSLRGNILGEVFNMGAGNYTLFLTGTGSPLAVTTFQKGTGSTVTYTGTTTATVIAAKQYNNLTITPTAATAYSLAGHLNAAGSTNMTGNLTINNYTTLTTTASNYNLDCVNLTVASGSTLTANASTFTISGNFVRSGTFTYNTSKIIMSQSGSIAGGTSFWDLEAAHTGYTNTFASNITVFHQLNLAGDSTGHLNDSNTYSATIFYGANLASPSIISSGATYTGNAAAGWFGTNGTTYAVPTGTFYNRIWMKNISGTAGTANFELGGDISLPGGFYVFSDDHGGVNNTIFDLKGYSINNGAGPGTNSGLYIGENGNIYKTATIKNTSTLSDSTLTFKDINIYAGSSTSHNILDCSGTRTINLNISGTWTNFDTFTAGTSTVNFIKTSGTQTLNSGGTGAGQTFNNLTHSGAGTLQLITNNLNIDGSFTNSAGTFDANSMPITVAGNWNNTGGTYSDGLVPTSITFDGAGAQTITAGGTGAGHTPKNLTVTNASASGVTFADSLTLAAGGTLADNTGDSHLTFNAGSTYTIPTLDLDGTSGHNIILRSSSVGTAWNLNVTNAPTLTYVDAQDSNAGSGALITANTSNDSGHNTNWNFGGGVTYISGTVYTNENKSTNVGAGITVAVSVNGGAKNTTTTIAGGIFSFNSVGVAANNTLTFFTDDVTNKSNLVTQVLNTTNDITGLEMYTGDISLRHETAGPMTNTLLDTADNLGDANMFFSVSGGNATFTKKLWIESGFAYTPGGQVIDTSDLEVRGTGTFAPQANAVSVSGNWTMSATGIFTTSGTVTFDKGSATQTLVSGGKAFSGLTHSEAGILQLITNDLTANGTFTNSAGTFDSNNLNMIFAGDWNNTGSATFTRGSGTMTFSGTSIITNSSSAAASLAAVAISGTATLGSSLTMTSNSGVGTLNLGADSYTLTITDTGTPLGVTTFQKGTGSTVIYTGTTIGTTIAAKQYNNLTLTPTAATTYSLGGALSGSTAMTGDLTINSGATLTTTISNYNIDLAGNWTNLGTFMAGTSTVTFNGITTGHTINAGTSGSFYNLTFNGAGGAWSPLTNTITVSNNLTMTAGIFDTSSGTADVVVNGNIVGTAGIINMTSTNTFTQRVGVAKNFGTTSGSTNWTFYNLKFENSSVGNLTITTSGAATGQIITGNVLTIGNATDTNMTTLDNETNDRIINAVAVSITSKGILSASSTASFTVSGDWANSGTFTANAGTVDFNRGVTTQTLDSGGVSTGKIFNNLTHSGAGTLQLSTNAINIDGNFANSAGTFDANGLNVNVAKDWNISGGSFSAGATPGTQTVTFDSTNAATVSGSTTFNNLTMDANTDGAKQINFTAGTTQTISSGKTWTLNGALGKVLTLRSTVTDSPWYFVIPADMTSGSYIDVKDSQNITNAYRITPGSNVTDSGNNFPGWLLTPSSPTIGTPEAISATTIRWTFTDNSSTETGFKVYDAGNNLKATCASPNLTYCDETSLLVNTQYSGRYVVSYNPGGNSPHSGTAASIYTLANTPLAPTVNQISSTNLQVIINTNLNPVSTQFTIYNNTLGQYVQPDGTNNSTIVWQDYATWGGTTGVSNTNLIYSTAYTYQVKARNGDNTETALSTENTQFTLSPGTGSKTSPSPEVSPSVTPTLTPSGEVTGSPTPTGGVSASPTAQKDIQAPTAPSNLRATKLGAITLTLAWDASQDDTGVKGYDIYNAQTGIKVGTTTNTSFDFSGLTPNTVYKFYVRAFDSVPYYSPNSEVAELTTSSSKTEEEKTIEKQGGIAAFLILGNMPKEASVGQPFNNKIKVTVADVGGSIVKGYAKAVYFTSSDALAQLSYNEAHPYTFTAADAGIHEFASNDFVLNTGGRQQLTVSDNSVKSTVEITVNSTVATVLQKSVVYVGGFFNNPEQVSQANLTVAILIAGALLLPILINGFSSLNNLWPLILYWFTYLSQILGLRRRRKTWGIVFNSQTGQPVPFALVKLLDKSGRLVELSISDNQGRYGLTPKHGIFTLKVSRADFVFPSESETSIFYEKIYTDSEIKIVDANQSVAFNIPLDPHSRSTAILVLLSWLVKLNHLIQKVRLPLFVLGAIFSLTMIVINFVFLYVVFLAYCVFMIIFDVIRLSRATAAGTVSDVYSHPISGAIVRIYHKQDNRLVETDISNKHGRFKFKVQPGVYYLVATKPNYIDSKTHLMYLEKGQKKGAISSINIKLKKEE